MRAGLGLLFGFCALMLGAGAADADDGAAPVVVTYFEVVPSAAQDGAALVERFGAASREDDGARNFEVLRESGRPDRFVVLESWRDGRALAAHDAAAHSRAFRERLQPLLASPYDRRPHTGVAVGPTPASPAGAVHVVTHVDIVPPSKEEGQKLLAQLVDESRRDPGNLRFDLLQQNSRPNHFTLVEVWQDRKAFDAHEAAATTRQFRDRLLPLTGSLYDQRLFTALGKSAP